MLAVVQAFHCNVDCSGSTCKPMKEGHMRSQYHATDPRYYIDGLQRMSDPPESADSSHSDIATHDDSLADRDQTSVSCYARVKLARSIVYSKDGLAIRFIIVQLHRHQLGRSARPIELRRFPTDRRYKR
jgi:hypothetical protein